MSAPLLEIEPRNCLVNEASVLGVRSGKAAGADVIAGSFAALTKMTNRGVWFGLTLQTTAR